MKNRMALAVILLFVSVLIAWGCQRSSTTSTTSKKIIAIATLMSHPALDEAKVALKEELAKRGYREGENIQYVERNANSDPSLTSGIARELSSSKPDVIVAITTPMAQAVVATAFRPVVFVAVTDPVGAKLVRSLDVAENGITGTSDAWPYEQQLKLIRRVTPSVKRIGVLFNPGEAASQYGMRHIRELAPKMGFTLVEGSVDKTTSVYPVAQSLVGRIDALFLSSDNTVIGGAPGAIKVAFEKHIPLYVGDSGTVEKGGLASVSVGYRGLGQQTGILVDRILRGEHSIPTVVCTGDETYVNSAAASRMGVKIPLEVVNSAKKNYDTIK